MTSQKFIARDLLFLTLFLALLFGTFLGTRPLMTPDEGRYVEIPREMVESDDYLTPHLNYIKYFEKPALFYWMIAGSIKLFGLNEWTLRAVVSIMSLLGCLMVYIAGLRLYDRRTGLLACLILATCALYFSMARFIITDMPVTLWMTASLLLFMMGVQTSVRSNKRYYFWGMYITAALAVMTKGLIGMVIPGLVIFSWLCVTRQWKQLKTYCLPTGILLFLLIAAPWHILVQLKNPEFFRFYFIEQHFLRYFTDYAGRQQAVWFFPAITLGGFFPWICFLLPCLFTLFKEKKVGAWLKSIPFSQTAFSREKIGSTTHIMDHLEENGRLQKIDVLVDQTKQIQITAFFALWVVILFVFFSLSKSQLLSYALPLMPPLAILVGRYFSLHWEETTNHTISIGFLLVALLGFAMSMAGMIALYMKAIPASWVIYASIVLLPLGTLTSYVLYQYRGIQVGIATLIFTTGICFILGDLAYPKIDTRSVKPLVMMLKPLLKPNTEVVSYHEYYQDLPVYLGRRVTVVDYKGELAFGSDHQDVRAWMLDEQTFWRRWRNQPGMFMIVSLDDYAVLLKKHVPRLYPLGQTAQDILLANSR